MLRYCFLYPKFSFMLRLTPAYQIHLALQRFDNIIFNALNRLLNSPLTILQISQASLPTKLGGLALTMANQNAPICFLESLNSSLLLQQKILNNSTSNRVCHRNIYDSMELIAETTNLEIETLNNAFTTFGIKSLKLSELANQSKFNWIHAEYIKNQNDRDAARILSVSGNHAMKWTNALPIKNYGLKLSNNEFQIAAKLALGCNQYPTNSLFCTSCEEISDINGHHATYCKKEVSTNKRHNDLRNYIYSIAIQGCLTAYMEKKDLFDGQERPADIFIANYKEGKDYLFDVGITCPTSLILSKNAAKEKNYAAEKFGKTKVAKVASKLLNTNYFFAPLIAETFGSWTDASVKHINEIIKYYATHQSLNLASTKDRIWTKIAILLQKANAYAIQLRMPADPF